MGSDNGRMKISRWGNFLYYWKVSISKYSAHQIPLAQGIPEVKALRLFFMQWPHDFSPPDGDIRRLRRVKAAWRWLSVSVCRDRFQWHYSGILSADVQHQINRPLLFSCDNARPQVSTLIMFITRPERAERSEDYWRQRTVSLLIYSYFSAW